MEVPKWMIIIFGGWVWLLVVLLTIDLFAPVNSRYHQVVRQFHIARCMAFDSPREFCDKGTR